MAQYGITRSCGHRETVRVGGPTRQRPYLLAREEERLCYACWQERAEKQRAAETAAAAAVAAAQGLPALTGSPKQVAWAESLRREKLARIDAALAGAALTAEEKAEADRVVAKVRAQAEARYWIDHRDIPVHMVLAEMARTLARVSG